MKKSLITLSLLIAASSISAVSYKERFTEAKKTSARNWECLFIKNPKPPCTLEEKKRARIAAQRATFFVGTGVGIAALGSLGRVAAQRIQASRALAQKNRAFISTVSLEEED